MFQTVKLIFPWSILLCYTNISLSTSSPPDSDSSEYPLHRCSSMHGLPSTFQHLGQTGEFLAREHTIRGVHSVLGNTVFKHGWLHTSVICECYGIVSISPLSFIPDHLFGDCKYLDERRSTAYCWGNFTGPFVVKESEAPDYATATVGLLVGYSIKTGCHLALLGIISVASLLDKWLLKLICSIYVLHQQIPRPYIQHRGQGE